MHPWSCQPLPPCCAVAEPLPEGHWMYTHPNVRLSAHISWSMPAALDALVDVFVENLRRYERGEPLLGLVDVEAGY